VKLLLILMLLPFFVDAQKINYTTTGGVFKIQGIDGTNPVIYDNDIWHDTPEGFFIWLKANRKEVNLVGNVSTRNMFKPPSPEQTHDDTYRVWMEAYNYATQAGLKNILKPVKGSGDWLRKPASGNIDDTPFRDSEGVTLIINEARKASAAKPLVIFVGGSITSVADAYLKDKTIADKVIVFQVDGTGQSQHNATDTWAQEVVVKRMKYINWSGDLYSWYIPSINQNVSVSGLPNNPFANFYRNGFYNQAGSEYPQSVGDSPPVCWFFDNSVWRNVVRKTFSNQTITGDNFDYLLISENNWTKYGQMLNAVMLNAQSYVPVTTTTPPPVIPSSTN